MKRFLSIALVINSFALLAQQSAVQGVVSIHNSGYRSKSGMVTYVSLAQVEEDFGRSQATATDADGRFRLVLIGIAEKQGFSFSVVKEGLEVVNIDQLSAVAGQKDTIKLSMAAPRQLADFRKQIYQIGRTAAEQSLSAKLSQTRQALQNEQARVDADRERISKLQQRLQELTDAYAKIDERARSLSEKYTRINLDEVSPLYQAAFHSFQQGELDAALAILNEADLSKQAKNILEEEARIKKLQQEVAERDSLKEKRKESLMQAMRFKADLHATLNQFDSVALVYGLLLQLDDQNLGNRWDFAYFLDWQNRHDEAIQQYEVCLQLTANKAQEAAFKNNLGTLYSVKNEYARAEAMYTSALQISRQLAQIRPATFEAYVAMTQNNLGLLYLNKNEYTRADSAYREALQLYQRLAAQADRYEQDVAMTLNNLGTLYRTKNDYAQSETAYLNALRMCRQLKESNPALYEQYLAMIQNNLGNLYEDQEAYEKAEAAYLEALEVRQKLARSNPATYDQDVADTQNNLGVLYRAQKVYDKAVTAYREALQIYQRLARINPAAYDPNVATTQSNLGNVYSDQSDTLQAESAYLESLQTYQRLAQNDPEAYDPYVATTQSNLGLFYMAVDKPEEAGKALLDALTIYRRFAGRQPDVYDIEVARTTTLLALLKQDTGAQEEALISFREALAIADQYPQIPLAGQISKIVIRSIGIEAADPLLAEWQQKTTADQQEVDRQSNEKDKAKPQEKIVASWEKALRQHPDNPRIRIVLSQQLGGLSWYQLFTGKFAEAEVAARRALELDPSASWVYANLANALVLQGRYASAQPIYEQFKGRPYDAEQGWEQVFLSDLNTLEEAGISHPDVAKAREYLQQ